MTRVPVSTIYVYDLSPGKSVSDLHVDSVREAFALQCGVSTAAVTFESEPLDVAQVATYEVVPIVLCILRAL